MDAGYLASYLLSAASIGAIFLAVAYHSRKAGIGLGPSRIAGLTRSEAARLKTGDAVFLMHVSIALGVGLSVFDALVNPFLGSVPILKTVLLYASLPLLVGLIAAFVWRIQRLTRSKSVESELLKTSRGFTSASTRLQIVLMAAILLTTAELVLEWISGGDTFAALIGAARNGLVAAYYSKPTVNLIGSFDRPPSAVRTPFKLADVLSGTTDLSTVPVGISKLSQFDPMERLSYDSCVEIGACEASCPATAAGRPLSPRVLVRKLSLAGAAKGSADLDPFGVVDEEELWSCTSCGACVSSCPVGVNHLDIVYDLRRTMANAGKVDKEKSALLQNLAKSQNPYGFSPASRGDWAAGTGVDTLSTNPNAEYLYWVGCVASFDQRAQRVAKAMAKILRSASVSFAILGREEACNGDPARRIGDEARYQELAYQNIEKLNSSGVKKIITTCPHCYNTLGNEYPKFGGEYEVVYHTQLISDLVRSGRIAIDPERAGEISVTLHDACYASRYNSIFDEPREALKGVSARLHEMHRNKEKTFCCGAGGSNYWYKVPQQKSIAAIRTEEALGTGAKTIATECPFCLSMFDDTTRVMNTGMDVRDVAEIVAERLA
ncbi:MAG: (Fe-S)-binding protein [Thaumarchaeota archaeon]|nr:(Fe-S)-binding protein [Nitrososphaerota archaeon]